jgi:hypothetical protein
MKFEKVTCAECNAELTDPMAQCPHCGGWERLATFDPRYRTFSSPMFSCKKPKDDTTIGKCTLCGAEAVEICPFGGCRTCHAQSYPVLDWDKCQADWAKAMNLKRQLAHLHEKPKP